MVLVDQHAAHERIRLEQLIAGENADCFRKDSAQECASKSCLKGKAHLLSCHKNKSWLYGTNRILICHFDLDL